MPIVLALGTALAGVGFCVAGLSQGIAVLMAALVIAGVGASVQHPLASALVARAYAGPRSLKALGTYNFAGDLGKMTLPLAASLLMIVMPWRPTLGLLGALGLLAAIIIYLAVPHVTREAPPASKRERQRDGRRAPQSVRVSAAPFHRRHRQRDAHGLSHLPALCAHRQRREPAGHRVCTHVGVYRRRRGQACLRLHRRAYRRGCDGVADGSGDGAGHCRVAQGAARSGAWCCCR